LDFSVLGHPVPARGIILIRHNASLRFPWTHLLRCSVREVQRIQRRRSRKFIIIARSPPLCSEVLATLNPRHFHRALLARRACVCYASMGLHVGLSGGRPQQTLHQFVRLPVRFHVACVAQRVLGQQSSAAGQLR
jgi:hypothetical protein